MDTNQSLKSRTTSGVVWSFVESFSRQGVQFVISLILARLLIPSDYGIIGMLSFFMGISSVFIDGGFGSALIQKKDRTEKDLCTVFYIGLGMSIFFYLILAFFAPLIAEFYNQPILINVIRVYCLTLVIGSLASINAVLLTIKLDFKTQSKITLSSAVLSGIIGIIFAYIGYGVWALIIQSLTYGIISCIQLYYFMRWFPKLIFSKESFKKLFGFGSKLLLSSLIASAYANIYSLVIGKLFKPAILGYYSRATNFLSLSSSNINTVLSRVSYPLLSQIQDEDETLKRIYHKYIQMTSFIIFPLVLLLCGIAKPLILTLLGNNWSFTIILLQILSFAYLWEGIINVNLNILKVKGRSDFVLKLEIIKKSTAFTILIISCFFHSIYTICIGSVLYNFFALAINTIYSKKLMNFGLFEQFKEFGPYLLLAIVSMLVALIISHLIQIPYVALTLQLIICPIIYLFLCKIFNLYAYNEAKNIFISYRKKLLH